jgi:hypothetical protein
MNRTIRLWPGVAAAAVLLMAGFIVPFVLPAWTEIGQIAAMISAFVIVIWWLALSRAPWLERLGALAAMAIAVFIAHPFLDPSIAGGGQGAFGYILPLPLMGLALVAWASVTRDVAPGARRVSLAAAVLLACQKDPAPKVR